MIIKKIIEKISEFNKQKIKEYQIKILKNENIEIINEYLITNNIINKTRKVLFFKMILVIILWSVFLSGFSFLSSEEDLYLFIFSIVLIHYMINCYINKKIINFESYDNFKNEESLKSVSRDNLKLIYNFSNNKQNINNDSIFSVFIIPLITYYICEIIEKIPDINDIVIKNINNGFIAISVLMFAIYLIRSTYLTYKNLKEPYCYTHLNSFNKSLLRYLIETDDNNQL